MLLRRNRDLTMAEAARGPGGSRVDLVLVAAMVERGSRVLAVGCGDGELLRLLSETRALPALSACTTERDSEVGNSQSDVNETTQKRVGVSLNALASTPPQSAAKSK